MKLARRDERWSWFVYSLRGGFSDGYGSLRDYRHHWSNLHRLHHNCTYNRRLDWSWYQFHHFRLTYSFTHHFFLFWFTTLLIRNFLFHSRLKTYLFGSTNPTPVVSLLPPGLPSRNITRTVSPELLGFCFSPWFFVSGPCARLSWPSRQRLIAR